MSTSSSTATCRIRPESRCSAASPSPANSPATPMRISCWGCLLPSPAWSLQNCHPERSSASAPNAVEGPAVASHSTATNPRTSPRAPKRVYTDEEKDFLKCTTSSTHYAPVHRPRPESITDDDIIAAINALRRRCSLGPVDTDPNWNKATLSANPVHPPASRYPEASASTLASGYPEASASGLSPAAQEEGALAPGESNSATLPTLNAVADPLPSRAQVRREQHQVPLQAVAAPNQVLWCHEINRDPALPFHRSRSTCRNRTIPGPGQGPSRGTPRRCFRFRFQRRLRQAAPHLAQGSGAARRLILQNALHADDSL